MIQENEKKYNAAFQHAVETKKIYIADALQEESSSLLNRLALDGSKANERRLAYEQDVLPYWQRFGLSPEQMWFDLYGSRDGKMDPRFIPADLYYNDILPYINNGMQQHGLMNKGYLDYLFSDVNMPETVALNIEGTYTDEKRNIISERDAIGLCREHGGRLFLKLSTGSKGGKGITVFAPGSCTDDEIRDIFKNAGSSFIVQEQIKQHSQIEAINPSSVSTIRILSLLLEDEVSVESAVLRVSSPDMPFVSMHDGGFYAEILEDGRLYPKVFDNSGAWIDSRDVPVDDSFVVPFIDKVCREAMRIHPRMAHFKCIGWDFAVDDQGDPVLIEFNIFPGIDCSQLTCCKPIFGDKTDWILEDYFIHRKFEQNHPQNILIY